MPENDRNGAAYAAGKARLDAAIAGGPENAGLRLELGVLALVAGDFGVAEASLRRASELAPEDATPRLRLADVLAETGRFEEAAEALRAAARLAEGTPTGELASLEIELLERDIRLVHRPLAEARASVAARRPGRPGAHSPGSGAGAGAPASELNRLGALELLAGNIEEAAAAFRRALEADPEGLQAALNFGFVQGLASVEPSRLKRSVRELVDAAGRFPAEPRLHLHLAELYEASSLYDAAVQRIEKALEVSPSCVEAYDLAGRYLLLGAGEEVPLAGKIDEAVAGLERELDSSRGDAGRKRALGAALLGRARYRGAGKSAPAGPARGGAHAHGAAAEADFDRARDLLGEALAASGGRDEEAAIRLAECRERGGEVAEAGDLLRRAAEEHPGSYRPVFELGGLELRHGRPGEAAELFARAAELAPEEATIYQSLRYALSSSRRLRLAELTARTELAREAETPRPGGSVLARVKLGRAYLDAQRLGAALDTLKEAVAEAASAGASAGAAAQAHSALGRALARKGSTGEAEDAFRRAIKLDPSLPEAHRGLGNLLLEKPDGRREGVAELERYRELRDARG